MPKDAITKEEIEQLGEMPKLGSEGETQEPPKKPTLEELQAQLESAQAQIKKLNAESADRRKKLEAYEVEDTKRKQAEMSELQKEKARADDLEKKHSDAQAALETLRIKSTIQVAAMGLKFINADDAYNLADLAKVSVSDDGTVIGVDEALKELAKQRPYLLHSEQGGVGTPKPGSKPNKTGQPAAQQQPPARPTITL